MFFEYVIPPMLKVTMLTRPTPGETIIQRIFTELCKAVGWMHSVGLVHRDIKLESMYSTFRSNCFTEPLLQISS